MSLSVPILEVSDPARDAPPPPATPAAESDESAPRDYDLPIHSQMAIPGNYERDNDDKDKYNKIEEGNIFIE